MRSKTTYLLLFLAIFVAAAVLRLPRLTLRPFHGDEAVHAFKLNEMLRGEPYRYDPYEYHGPTLNFVTLPVMWALGVHDYAQVDEAAFRIVPVIFGLGLIALLPLVADGLGRGATLWAALFTAISPLMTFCSRYYVQETLLVFFTFGMLACGWRYVASRRVVWAGLAGVCAGLMHATKETCVIAFAAAAGAAVVSTLWNRQAIAADAPRRKSRLPVALLVGLFGAILASVAFFSDFFMYWQGPLDSVRTFAVYLDRGAGNSVHVHPWHYYLRMLLYTHAAPGPVWSEALIVVLALLGMIAAFRGRGFGERGPAFARFIALYTLLMVIAYSALPYKTPWSMLGFVHGLVLLAGVGAAAVFRVLRSNATRVPAGVLLLTATGQLAVQSNRTNLDPRFVADTRNPYVYAHPLRGVELMGSFVQRVADASPDGRRMFVRVLMPNAWPVPWYLRGLERVGYWSEPMENCDAPVVITASDLPWDPQSCLHGDYVQFHYSLRPDVSLLAFVEASAYKRFVERESQTASEESQ